jgi:hypothetical protein
MHIHKDTVKIVIKTNEIFKQIVFYARHYLIKKEYNFI